MAIISSVSDTSGISEHHDGKNYAECECIVSKLEVTVSRHTSVSPRWGTHTLLPCEQSAAPLEVGLSLAQAPEAPGHPALHHLLSGQHSGQHDVENINSIA